MNFVESVTESGLSLGGLLTGRLRVISDWDQWVSVCGSRDDVPEVIQLDSKWKRHPVSNEVAFPDA